MLAGPVTPIGPDNVILRRPRNPLLAAIRIHALTPSLSSTTQLMLGCGSRWPRYPIREAENDRNWLRLPEHHPELPEPNPSVYSASVMDQHNLAKRHGTARH